MNQNDTDDKIAHVESDLVDITKILTNFEESRIMEEQSTRDSLDVVGANVDSMKKEVLERLDKMHDPREGTVSGDFEILRGRFDMIEGLVRQLLPPSHGSPPRSAPSPANVDHTARSAELKTLKAELKKAQKDRDEWEGLYQDSEERRKHLKVKLEDQRNRGRVMFETLSAMKGNIRVMCRIRPAPHGTPQEELADFGKPIKSDLTHHWGTLRIPTERIDVTGARVIEDKQFEFERVFGQRDSNNDVFNEISDLIEHAMSGQKVGLFAYGQTGSGKTYTLSHKHPQNELEDGIVPRTIARMFDIMNTTSDEFKYDLRMSAIEIYADRIFDLMREPLPYGPKSEIRLDEALFVPFSQQAIAESMFEKVLALRATSSTAMNETSSRSHLIVSFKITRVRVKGGEKEEGLFNIVDLAGSERSAADGLEGQRLREGIEINQSLLSLNSAITAMAHGRVAAYDTALTRALRPVLSSDCKTMMFVMVSPFREDFITTMQTLQKGQEATNAKLASTKRTSRTGPRPTSMHGGSKPSASKMPPPASKLPRGGSGRGAGGSGGSVLGSSRGRPSSFRGGRDEPGSSR
ncbi:P-loop containing nucleoside triphosphate hydrolase protein [Hypoxylon trugodes]|uniref:P-loop containing nucleoside triphosphate hydrolase protein n=1 Tax=Hypoxylon trugodes TaxID=326681 RepID=UPI00219B638C|nr:P-loop containing nucleoside triphosphate hydrolase protein [Hypoxylon trugodes]KAI1393984.1 P-loop containing nucleoside triphosphate hydrolase protein [Hypoxylon trugodes]